VRTEGRDGKRGEKREMGFRKRREMGWERG
jgi:hypothetical protein